MKEVVKTVHYEIAVNEVKNRAYLKVIGFWRNADLVSGYVSDWRKTLTMLKPGFTLLTDLSTMITHPPEVLGVHQQVQKLVVEKKLRFTAEIKPKDIVTAMQVSKIAKASMMPVRQFASFEEAEAHLNSLG